MRHLDDVDARLQATLDLLRSTVVEASLRPAGEEDKTLHDFVDEGGVADLKAAIKGSIDERQVDKLFGNGKDKLLMLLCRKLTMNSNVRSKSFRITSARWRSTSHPSQGP